MQRLRSFGPPPPTDSGRPSMDVGVRLLCGIQGWSNSPPNSKLLHAATLANRVPGVALRKALLVEAFHSYCDKLQAIATSDHKRCDQNRRCEEQKGEANNHSPEAEGKPGYPDGDGPSDHSRSEEKSNDSPELLVH